MISKENLTYILSKLNIHQSINGRDIITKALYSKIFDYIVGKINRAIVNKEEMNKINKNNIYKIGLLDIFGLENFDNNSFEQLCINYSNEKLQQYFNNHIFKLEHVEQNNKKIIRKQREKKKTNQINYKMIH